MNQYKKKKVKLNYKNIQDKGQVNHGNQPKKLLKKEFSLFPMSQQIQRISNEFTNIQENLELMN